MPKDCGLSIEAGRLNGVVYRGAQKKYVLAVTVNAGTLKGPAGERSYTGRWVSEAEFAKQNPKPKTDYPCWRNNGSGAGGETSAKLVGNPSQIRVLWKREELIPPGYHEGINFPSPCGIQSGHCSPPTRRTSIKTQGRQQPPEEHGGRRADADHHPRFP